jgi:hypothetical protein
MSEHYVKIESFRNRVTWGGVVIYEIPIRVSNFALIEHFGGSFIVRCILHGVDKGFRNLTEARKVVHRPWLFCETCKRIMEKTK